MKTLIAILIIASFLQATILPINLVLIILICRSFIKQDRANLYFAFSFGLLNSHLSLAILGIQSIAYLIVLELTQMLSLSRLAKSSVFIIPIAFIFLSLYTFFTSLITHLSFQLFPKVIIESLLSFPLFYLIREWEERFIVRGGIKLKIKD